MCIAYFLPSSCIIRELDPKQSNQDSDQPPVGDAGITSYGSAQCDTTKYSYGTLTFYQKDCCETRGNAYLLVIQGMSISGGSELLMDILNTNVLFYLKVYNIGPYFCSFYFLILCCIHYISSYNLILTLKILIV